MIYVVPPSQYRAYGSLLDQMFQQRHRVLIEILGWELRSKNRREWDQYDDLDPTYILSCDSDDHLQGSWRILPTTGRYMIPEVFPFTFNGLPTPSAPEIWEISRFVVEGRPEAVSGLRSLSRATSELYLAVCELGLAVGIEDYVCAYDLRVSRLMARAGAQPYWEGPPTRIGNCTARAARFECSPAVLTRLRRHCAVNDSIIVNDFDPRELTQHTQKKAA